MRDRHDEAKSLSLILQTHLRNPGHQEIILALKSISLKVNSAIFIQFRRHNMEDSGVKV